MFSMSSTLMVHVGVLVLLVMFSKGSDCQNFIFTVGIDYDYESCGSDLSSEPPELSLSLFPGATALDIMEGAANVNNYYRFIVTFLGDQGYSIDAINGTMSNELCQWHLFVDTLNGSRSLTQLHHVLPNDTSSAVLHYTTPQEVVQPLPLTPEVGHLNLSVYYVIEYEDRCNNGTSLASSPLRVIISEGDTALHVLENALHTTNDSTYQFTATYFRTFGYHVHTINGTASNDPCYWFFYYMEPNGTDRVESQVGVAHYVIPGNNYTVIMRYVVNPYAVSVTTSSVTTSSATSPSDTIPRITTPSVAMQNTPLSVVSLLGVIALCYCYIVIG